MQRARRSTAQRPTAGTAWVMPTRRITGNPADLATSRQIEITYTLYGDANLDGVVNGTDFGILAAHFGRQVTVGTKATSTTMAWSTAATSVCWRPTSASRRMEPISSSCE